MNYFKLIFLCTLLILVLSIFLKYLLRYLKYQKEKKYYDIDGGISFDLQEGQGVKELNKMLNEFKKQKEAFEKRKWWDK